MQILAAYFHFLGLAVMSACLVAEYCLLQPSLTVERLRSLKRVDMTYGLIAGLMLASGLVRIYIEKGPGYYTGNSWFWLKMVFFALAGLISLYPTIIFLRCQTDQEQELPMFSALRNCLYVQMGLVGGTIGCAVLMAR